MHWQKTQKQLLLLALPMIVSNITTPLLGLVDTAVIGHLPHAYYLGGIAVGAMVISLIFWLAGSLRMATTGVIAQALGEGDQQKAWNYLGHSLALALSASLLLLLFQWPIQELAMVIVGGSEEVQQYARAYFSIRIYSSPAALANLVFLGYFIASQRIKWLVAQLFVVNSINIALDLWFVIGLNWGVKGAALASVLADYCGLFLLVTVLFKELKNALKQQLVWCKTTFSALLNLNQNIFIRSLVLQLCIAYMTVRGARLGDVYLAANAILLNLFIFASYGLDGFAYAAESLVGQAYGKVKKSARPNNWQSIHQVVFISGVWSAIVGIGFALALWLWGNTWVKLLTDIPEVITMVGQYLPWMVAIIAVAWLTFLLDGVYIGLTRATAMRNNMIFSGLIFFLILSASYSLHNHGLWLAFFSFILIRGLSLTWHYYRHAK